MKISKIFYLFNILFAINLLAPCFCFVNDQILKEEMDMIDTSIKKKEKKKKIIIASIATVAAVLIAAGLIGGGLYLNRDKFKSVWKNPQLGNVSSDIFFRSSEKLEEDVKKRINKGEKNLDKIFTKKYIKSVIDNEIQESGHKFSGIQKRELYVFIPHLKFLIDDLVKKESEKKNPSSN
ncbi:early transcribed membrane protein [Plasmodium relictum]|uniref:Early transcribed membrane protein n=1 Tax=Plasmodium relictum TaxID=85471 RepID=A0A1J1GJZ8_PLARL|nr:early transcribed membrane protein [Plasmodium relictum]CRG84393.1 early transcribed membrane protein [Plasmodium relictum]